SGFGGRPRPAAYCERSFPYAPGVPVLKTAVDRSSEQFVENRAAMVDLLAAHDEQVALAVAGGGERYNTRHHDRGKLLARERAAPTCRPRPTCSSPPATSSASSPSCRLPASPPSPSCSATPPPGARTCPGCATTPSWSTTAPRSSSAGRRS